MSTKNLAMSTQVLSDWIRRHALETESIAHELDLLALELDGEENSQTKTRAWMLRGYAHNLRNMADSVRANMKLTNVSHLEK